MQFDAIRMTLFLKIGFLNLVCTLQNKPVRVYQVENCHVELEMDIVHSMQLLDIKLYHRGGTKFKSPRFYKIFVS